MRLLSQPCDRGVKDRSLSLPKIALSSGGTRVAEHVGVRRLLGVAMLAVLAPSFGCGAVQRRTVGGAVTVLGAATTATGLLMLDPCTNSEYHQSSCRNPATPPRYEREGAQLVAVGLGTLLLGGIIYSPEPTAHDADSAASGISTTARPSQVVDELTAPRIAPNPRGRHLRSVPPFPKVTPHLLAPPAGRRPLRGCPEGRVNR